MERPTGLTALCLRLSQAADALMVDSAMADARSVLAPITMESELAALPGQFISLVPQETEVTRQTLEGMFLYAMAELVQAMESHMPATAKHIKLQDALEFSVAAGPRTPVYRAFMPYPLAKLIMGTTLIVEAMGTTHAFTATLTEVRLPPVQDAGRENSKFWATLDLTPDYILLESHLVAPISSPRFKVRRPRSSRVTKDGSCPFRRKALSAC
jgi:hypothetical protein